jgi:hypothetical protein
MYIVGGFLDSRDISENVFMQILRKYFRYNRDLKSLVHTSNFVFLTDANEWTGTLDLHSTTQVVCLVV